MKSKLIFSLLLGAAACLFLFAGIGSAEVSDPSVFGSKIVNIRDYGAVGDGIHDDREAIQQALDDVSHSGGGTVTLPEGTFLLASPGGADPDSYGILTARSNVRMVGSGDATIIKVASGMNKKIMFNVIGSISILTNAAFENFVIDANGENNVLTAQDQARHNAGIMALNGGNHVLIDHLTVKNVAGNQCIFFPATADEGQGYITISNSTFSNVASAIPGNYNIDHSSIYLNGKHNQIMNNHFSSERFVDGTAFEIHGSYTEAYGNYVNNYNNSFYVVSNYEELTGVNVHDNLFENVNYAFLTSGKEYNWGTVDIHHNRFIARPDVNGAFFAAAPEVLTDEMNIHDNEFIGAQNGKQTTAIQINLTKKLTFVRNIVKNFSGRALSLGQTDLGDGYMHHELRIEDNQFSNFLDAGSQNNVFDYMYIYGVPRIGLLSIQNNTLDRAEPGNIYPIVLNAPTDRFILQNNNISGNLRLGSVLVPNAPKQVHAAAVGASHVVLQWTPGDIPAASYAIYNSQGAEIATAPGNTSSYAVAGLLPGTAYAFSVKARDGYGNLSSGDSNTVEVTTATVADSNNYGLETGDMSGWSGNNDIGGSAVVDNGVFFEGHHSLQVTASTGGNQYYFTSMSYGSDISGQTFTVSARVKTDHVTGDGVKAFIYWQSENGWIWSNLASSAAVSGTSDWTQVTATAQAPQGATSVYLFVSTGNSQGKYWVDGASIGTQAEFAHQAAAAPPPPAAPQQAKLLLAGSDRLALQWQPAAAPPAVFVIYDGDTVVDTVAKEAVNYAITGLKPGSSHKLSVRARDTYGNLSAPSNVVTASTLAASSDNFGLEAGNMSSWSGNDDIGGSAVIDTTTVTQGTYSLKVSASAAGNQYYFTSKNYGADIGGKTFAVSARIKTSQVSGEGVKVCVYWQNENGWIWSNLAESAALQGSSDWTKLTASAKAPPGATSVYLLIKTGNSQGTYWVDQAEIN